MKRQIITLIFLISLTTSFAQKKDALKSKAETESWILSKFNKYSQPELLNPPNGSPPTVAWYVSTVNQFSFDEHYLIISSTIKQTNDRFPKSERLIVEKIPISDISIIGSYNNYRLTFETNKETIITIRNVGNETVSKNASFGFKCDTETDLIERIKKAFINLKRFYKMPENNEAF